jgi:hypothetical protein
MKKRMEKVKFWLQFFGKRLSDLLSGIHRHPAAPPRKPVHPEQVSATLNGDKELFVVWDAIGDGRVVGVFSKETLAEEIRAINPYYFRYYRCQLDLPTDYEIEWLDDEQKWKLERLRIKYGLPRK